MKYLILFFIFPILLYSQPWQQNDAVFNPSGVPSLPFSQPRFADLDGDGDLDLFIGNLNDALFYLENNGTAQSPAFTEGDNIFVNVSALDAEVGVCVDIDNDLDLDLIAGGYNGLNLFLNNGTVYSSDFQLVPGFFAGLDVGSNPVPDLADLDNDQDLDLVVGMSENGTVKIYTNVGSVNLAEFFEANVSIVGDVGLYAYPNFCDLDDDNDQDLLVGRDVQGFVFYKNVGNPEQAEWEVDTAYFAGLGSDTYWNSPDLVDLNGDSTYDLIYGTAAGPLQYYVNNGTPSDPSWQLNTTLFGGVIDVGGASNPVFYDFDGDEDLDLISGSNLGNIKYYENVGSIYGPAWEEDNSYFAAIDLSIYSAITIGDVNSDGLPDALTGDLSGNFFFYLNTGTGFSYQSDVLNYVDLGDWSVPRLVDLDFDNDLDIVAGNEDGNLFYFENQGDESDPEWLEIAGFFGTIDVGTNCVPTLSDLDFDGDLDLLAGNLWGELKYFENYSGLWQENPFPFAGISGEQNTAPALADLDADGDPDLVLGNYDGTFNYYENLHPVTEIVYEEVPKPDLELRNYPNPFNPNTTISFSIALEARTTLEVFSLRGDLIKRLLNDSLEAGNYAYVWDGRDKKGKQISSGVYFCRIISGNSSQTRKMLLVK